MSDVMNENLPISFDERLLPLTELKSGNIHCMYEHGRLRYLMFDGTEFLRMIYFAVRDERWATSQYAITDEQIEQRQNGFFVSYTAIHTLNDISYQSKVTITAEGNRLWYSVKGKALTGFKRNRIGICALHPLDECINSPVTITSDDGVTEEGKFPHLIAPHQPFRNIREMSSKIAGHLNVHIKFSGDLFEMEDQRNWSDASFKTYSTPLSLPFPVWVNEGDELSQDVEININSSGHREVSKDTKAEQKRPFPRLGYSRVSNQRLKDAEIHLLRQLPFDHYRVELSLPDAGWRKEWEDAQWEATQLDVPIELCLKVDDDYEKRFDEFISASGSGLQNVISVLPVKGGRNVTSTPLVRLVKSLLSKAAPHLKVGYGSIGSFADLNRNRPDEGMLDFDFINFPVSPQVHADDSRTIIENLSSHSHLMEAAAALAKGRGIRVSPITFGSRYASVDGRLNSGFGASWTIHAIKNLCKAEALTFYNTVGSGGILQPGGENDQSPLFNALKKIKEFNPRWIVSDGRDRLEDPVVFENDLGARLCVQTEFVK